LEPVEVVFGYTIPKLEAFQEKNKINCPKRAEKANFNAAYPA